MPANTSAPYSAGGVARPQMSWALSKDEKKKYDQIFRAWDPQSTGFLSGQTALEVFGASGLNKNDLARIWYVRRSLLCFFFKKLLFRRTLADGDNRGKLNMAEFHVAMGLIFRSTSHHV